MEVTHITDVILLERLEGSDHSAFHEIYRRYWYKLYQVARRKVHTEEDAEEIVQDIFVNLWERRSQVEVRDLRRFLYRSVKFQVLDYLKAQLVRQTYRETKSSFTDDSDTQTEEELALKDLTEAITSGLDQLPAKTQEIFRLNRLEDKSVKEIASLLAIPERTVEYHITQALRVMRSCLKEFIIQMLTVYLWYKQG